MKKTTHNRKQKKKSSAPQEKSEALATGGWINKLQTLERSGPKGPPGRRRERPQKAIIIGG